MARKDFSRIENDNSVNSDIAICERNEPGRAKDIMKCGVITIEKEKSVYEAIGILVERNISGLPVVDDTGLVGIISEKDVLKLLYDTGFLPGSVQDYMTKDVVSFDEEDSLKDISNCLMHNRFRRVPILHRGKLVGIISRADIIRANKERFKPKGPTEKSTNNGPLARDIMKCGLLVVKRQTPIYEAVEIIATRNITGLPVVDDYMNMVGIITEKDVLKLLNDSKAKSGKVEDLMTEEVVSFNHDDSLFDVCDCLRNNSFRRVPILNQGKIVGIISRADIIVYILRNKSAIFQR